MRSLNCELEKQFENFASASGRDLAVLTGNSPREAQSKGGRILLDVSSCGQYLNCRVKGHFENFSSASGRNLASLTNNSSWIALSEGGEWLGRSPP